MDGFLETTLGGRHLAAAVSKIRFKCRFRWGERIGTPTDMAQVLLLDGSQDPGCETKGSRRVRLAGSCGPSTSDHLPEEAADPREPSPAVNLLVIARPPFPCFFCQLLDGKGESPGLRPVEANVVFVKTQNDMAVAVDPNPPDWREQLHIAVTALLKDFPCFQKVPLSDRPRLSLVLPF